MRRCMPAVKRLCARPTSFIRQFSSLHDNDLLLVRHGQTDWNRVERFRGRVDVPFNDTGLMQAEATGRRIAEMARPVALFCSPLARAVKTAEAIGRHVNLAVRSIPA